MLMRSLESSKTRLRACLSNASPPPTGRRARQRPAHFRPRPLVTGHRLPLPARPSSRPDRPAPPQPLWGGAAKLAGARFTPQGAFDSIYLAHDPITAFIEVSALVLLPGGPVPIRSAPWVVVTVDGMLNSLLDLTDAA